MDQNNKITIPIAEYYELIGSALLLEELLNLGVEKWEFFDEAVKNLDESLNVDEDGTQEQS